MHGLASNSTRWSEFVATTSLREDWDILRLDLRGQGASVHRGRMGMDVWCDDLAAIVNAEPHETVVVVGHCLGANIALEFGRRRPKAGASQLSHLRERGGQLEGECIDRQRCCRPICAEQFEHRGFDYIGWRCFRRIRRNNEAPKARAQVVCRKAVF